MTFNSDDEKLSEQRYVIVILRLLVNRQGSLVEGEMINENSEEHRRFVDWQGLNSGLKGLLSTRGPEDSATDPSE